MKKTIIMLYLLVLTLAAVSSVFAAMSSSANPCILNVSMINQDPYPAAPNSYVKLLFQVSGVDNLACLGAKFRLIQSYPFSLDSGDELKVINEGGTYVSEYNNNWMLPYKVRVDKDAVEGNNEVKVSYSLGAKGTETNIEKSFLVNIKDTRTSFDAVIQDVSSSAVSIALANVGKYAANAVVIRIPEQDDFKAAKTNGQMVGNLASGDYTLVGFDLTRAPQVQAQRSVNMTRKTTTPDLNKESMLKFDIYYTDSIGERRVVNMELPLMTSYIAAQNSTQLFSGARNFSKSASTSLNWWSYAAAAFVILFAGFLWRKSIRRKRLLSRHSSKQEWMKK